MTEHVRHARPGLPLLLLLLAVLTHTGLGPLLACDSAGQVSRTDLVSIAAVTTAAVTEPAVDPCPGCPRESVAGSEAATTDVSSSDAPSSLLDPCTSDRPCQHGPAGGHGAGHTAVRSLDSPRHDDSDLLPACLAPGRPEPPAVPLSASGPVPPPAVLAPVAVLCVDRN